MRAIDMHVHVPRKPGLPEMGVEAGLRRYFRTESVPESVDELAAMYRDKVEVNTTIDIGQLHLNALIAAGTRPHPEIEAKRRADRIAAGLELPEAEIQEAEIEILPDESEVTNEFRADRDSTVADQIRVAFEKRESG